MAAVAVVDMLVYEGLAHAVPVVVAVAKMEVAYFDSTAFRGRSRTSSRFVNG